MVAEVRGPGRTLDWEVNGIRVSGPSITMGQKGQSKGDKGNSRKKQDAAAIRPTPLRDEKGTLVEESAEEATSRDRANLARVLTVVPELSPASLAILSESVKAHLRPPALAVIVLLLFKFVPHQIKEHKPPSPSISINSLESLLTFMKRIKPPPPPPPPIYEPTLSPGTLEP